MSSSESDLQARLKVEQPHSARIWNYLLGGKDNFASDRAAAEAVLGQMPEIREFAVAGRRLLARAIGFLAGEAGIRQFLDIGTGLPTANNTHELAQRIAPASKIVYVDNDPLVLVHARALLTSHPDGTTSYIDADVRDPEKILHAAADTLDFDQPIAVVMIGILGHIPDDDNPAAIVRTIVDALPSGSYLVINDSITTPVNDSAIETAQSKGANYYLRTVEQITAFFDGLDLVEPGVVSTPQWRPDSADTAEEIAVYCGVARKP
ncbi:SAM-dependent methyltransferase [Actinoplanes sp. KI2]|uniref:SAM-dependent methyltransferase n=1 Tax=Actinoplanes sp. KI2 TaxID=2983315 RepID=UPI0021D5C38B|nr:SAM-dependent methyltransferase [Actinoplanes sp. KI2]MCU7725386.1 SAM-dependent methyltransferase [Actinoplanes sp. KI2]